jgi:CheY-like chemotaxis protein
VLLAEDNPVNQRIAVAMLSRLGCEVTVAEDGLAAVEAFRARRFDVVFMDCQMPHLDGLQATARLRAIEAARGGLRTPILAMTASASAEDRQRYLEAGMDGLLPKPVRVADLAGALERWLGEEGLPSAPLSA